MSKYDALGAFLRRQSMSEVPLTFAEIEQITGVALPPNSQHIRAWWSNNASNNVMTKIWLAAGYRSERVDMAARKLVFRRVTPVPKPASSDGNPLRTTASEMRHPLFGALKGQLRILPGTDLTLPADPSWGEAQ